MDLELTGKRALVTGGSRGIGKAVARLLAQEGADVALLARDAARLAEAASEIAASTGRRVVGVSADTRSDDAVRAAVVQAREQLGGPITILVNAAAEPAGYATPPALEQIRGDFLHAELDVKVMGYIRTARELVPDMRSAGWGRIVNVSGLAARQTGSAVGSIRNVAVAALTKNMADELGPAGIQVTVVHPGATRTERTAPDAKPANSIGHLVTAEEVAQVIVFLCSPKSRAINGDAVCVGGGAPKVIHY